MIGYHSGDSNNLYMLLMQFELVGHCFCLYINKLLLLLLTNYVFSLCWDIRATGDDTRSLCTTVCKWTYLGHAHMEVAREKDSHSMEACGWDDVFWEEIGLGDLVEGKHAKIGKVPKIT